MRLTRPIGRVIAASAVLLALTATGVHAQPSGAFVCTQFVGYRTRQWYFGGFQAGGSGAYELRARDAAAVEFWADPGFEGWDAAFQLSRCARNSDRPDRIILDVTNDYQADVNWWIDQISAAVDTIHAKFPSVRQIVLQPVVGGPGGSQCRMGRNIVRASYNHPIIDQAIAAVAGGDVVVGADPTVRTCADYADDIGHLKPDAEVAVGNSIVNFYLQNGEPGSGGESN